MKKTPLFSAFGYAFEGIGHFFSKDRNGRIHLLITFLMILSGWYFVVSATEWCILLICFGLVISLEMCNHALEKLCDTVHPTNHPFIKVTKDVAAGAVLWSVVFAVIIGLIIFVPKIASLC